MTAEIENVQNPVASLPASPPSPEKISLVMYILSMIFVALLSGGSVYFMQKNIQNNSKTLPNSVCNNESSDLNQISPIPTTQVTNNFIDIEKIFNEISENNIVFNVKKDNVDVYESEYFDLSKYLPGLSQSVYLQINVYKYQKGAKFNSGYEGGEWVVNLDEWKQWLQNLSIGENKRKTSCSDWGCSNLETVQTFIVRKINNNKYLVSDGYFKPGGNSNRYYTAFDEQNDLIIDVRLDYYVEKDSAEMINIFSKIEKLLP